MTQARRDWDLELEESAQGTDSFTAPGAEIQLEEARAEATRRPAGEATEPVSSHRVEKVPPRRKVPADALTGLESAAAAPLAADGWIAAASSQVGELRRALEEHIDVTEGPHGLLEEISELAPRLSNEITSIKSEHEELLDSLQIVEVAVEEARAIRQRVLTILDHLSRHGRRGADLVYEAYNVDIAAGD